MENISPLSNRMRIPVKIPILPYLRDHCFEDKNVLPAVEIMQYLARATLEYSKTADVMSISNARFLRFLAIDENADTIEAHADITLSDHDTVIASFITVSQLPGGITRTKEHALLHFCGFELNEPTIAYNDAAALQGDLFTVTSKQVYGELVPFLKAYHNINGNIVLNRDGAVASVVAPHYGAAVDPLGSPFPMDAAFHAACVWGERYTGIVGFPMGFARRKIFKPTESGQVYTARIFPAAVKPGENIFDILLFDDEGGLCEVMFGLIMKDASGGRMRPPGWITV